MYLILLAALFFTCWLLDYWAWALPKDPIAALPLGPHETSVPKPLFKPYPLMNFCRYHRKAEG